MKSASMNLLEKSVSARKSNLTVPPSWSTQERRFADGVKENLDVMLGHRGDPLQRAVTFQDLLDANILELAGGVRLFGTINDMLPVVNDIPNLDVPPAPTSLQASGAFQNIILTWNLSLYRGHSYVEVFRHTSDSISDATMVAQVSGFTGVYADPVGSNQTFYYWARAVNVNGVQGPFNSGAGTQGQTSPDVSFLLTTLANAITSSELATSLSTPIGNLPTDTQTALDDLQSQVNAIGTVSQWSSSTSYSQDDLALYPATNSKLYRSKTNSNSNNQPSGTSSDTTYWEFVGTGSTLGDVVADNTSSITQINFLDATSSSAAAQKIAALDSTVFNASTGVSATSTALNSLTSRVTATESATSTNTTNITSAASDITALENTVNNASTGVAATSTALSGLTTRVTTAESTISGHTTSINAQSTDITALENTVNNPSTGVGATSSALSSLTSTVSTQGSTIASQGSSIASNSSSLTSLSTTVGSNTSSITSQASSINGLQSKYVVKIDNNGAVAGFGLASTANSAGNITSEFIVNADRFAIMRGGSNTTAASVPFTVQTSTTTLNGVTVPAGVYMTDGFIKNGSIVNAKIGNAAIDDAKIANLNAGKINAGTISTSRLNIDGSTLTSNNGVLQVNALNANVITSGLINSNRINIDNVTLDTDGQGRLIIKNLGVDSLQIKGNAVTIPTSAFTSSQINIQASAGDVTVQTLTYSSIGAPALIIASAVALPSGGRSHGVLAKIKRNGVTILEQKKGGAGSATGHHYFSISFTDFSTSTGTRTYTLTLDNTGSNPKGSSTTSFVTDRSLAVIEVKK